MSASTVAFYDTTDGTLDSIGASPFANAHTAPCWLTINPNGRYLDAVNTGSESVSS